MPFKIRLYVIDYNQEGGSGEEGALAIECDRVNHYQTLDS